MTAAVKLALLPEVDHVHQQLAAGAAYKAAGVPQLVISSPLRVHRWLALPHGLLALVAGLEGGAGRGERRTMGRGKRRKGTDRWRGRKDGGVGRWMVDGKRGGEDGGKRDEKGQVVEKVKKRMWNSQYQDISI